MNSGYKLKILGEKGPRKIDFENASDEFVEVIFVVNGKNLQTNKPCNDKTRGYCYPPGYHKEIKNHLLLGHGEVEARVFSGTGKIARDDSNCGPFVRFRVNVLVDDEIKKEKKVYFKRSSLEPIIILKQKF